VPSDMGIYTEAPEKRDRRDFCVQLSSTRDSEYEWMISWILRRCFRWLIWYPTWTRRKSDTFPPVAMNHRLRWYLSAGWFGWPAGHRMFTLITSVSASLLWTYRLVLVIKSTLRRTDIWSCTTRYVIIWNNNPDPNPFQIYSDRPA
jgi:hypothetical protein